MYHRGGIFLLYFPTHRGIIYYILNTAYNLNNGNGGAAMSFNRGAAKRVPLLDEFRGLVILLMVFYHGAYDLVSIFGVDFPFFYSPFMNYLQVFTAGTFILVSGIACRFSRSNLKRGALAFGLGLAFTAVTALVMPSQLVMFGVLHLLGSCMMLFALLEPLLDRIRCPALGVALCVALQALLLHVPYGQLGYPPFAVALPRALYDAKVLFWLGFPSATFYSSDYFPLIPWLFLFLAGSYLGVYFKNGSAPRFAYESHCKPLAAVGRRTIWIYLLHQPIIFGVLWVFFKLTGNV